MLKGRILNTASIFSYFILVLAVSASYTFTASQNQKIPVRQTIYVNTRPIIQQNIVQNRFSASFSTQRPQPTFIPLVTNPPARTNFKASISNTFIPFVSIRGAKQNSQNTTIQEKNVTKPSQYNITNEIKIKNVSENLSAVPQSNFSEVKHAADQKYLPIQQEDKIIPISQNSIRNITSETAPNPKISEKSINTKIVKNDEKNENTQSSNKKNITSFNQSLIISKTPELIIPALPSKLPVEEKKNISQTIKSNLTKIVEAPVSIESPKIVIAEQKQIPQKTPSIFTKNISELYRTIMQKSKAPQKTVVSNLNKTIETKPLQMNNSEPKKQLTLQQSVLAQAKQQKIKSTNLIPFTKIFERFVTAEEFQKIILSADTLPLVKSLQQTLGSDMTCQQKTSMLSDYFGRIQSAIQIKKYENKQIKAETQQINAELSKIKGQMQAITTQIINLQLDSLKKRQIFSSKELLTAYDAKNQVVRLQKQKQALIAEDQSKILMLKKQKQSFYDQMVMNFNMKLTNKNLKVDDLSSKIQKNQFDLKEIQKDKSLLEDLLENIIKNVDEKQRKYKILEVDAERLRSQISQKSIKQSELNKKYSKLNEKYKSFEKKINLEAFHKNQDLISSLQQILPNIQQKIDEQNFSCNKLKNFDSSNFNNQINYVVSPVGFANYIKNIYNQTIDITDLPGFRVYIYPITILSPVWQLNYGNPYTEDIIMNQNQNLYFREDFNCLNPQNLQTGFGKITSINRKFIILTNSNGGSTIVRLGCCTRVESIDKLPKVGQKLFFRGKSIGIDEYNAYKINCT